MTQSKSVQKRLAAQQQPLVMQDAELSLRLKAFRDALESLLSIKREMFPVPCVVFVHSGSFRGHGIVWKDHDEELSDRIFVLVESGNTWTYTAEDCRRERDRDKWPTWIKDDFKERGI